MPHTSEAATPESDVQVQSLGSLWVFSLLTEAAIQWADAHLASEDAGRESTSMLLTDWRMGRDIVEGMQSDGLTVVSRAGA